MHLETALRVSVGQASSKGLKEQNEDSLGYLVPPEPALTIKGMAAVIADGVSSAEAGREASETCVKNFLADYFCTPDSWSVKTSGQKILTALNRWLYGQGLSYLAAERGYISTFSVLVIKSRSAHVFHIGDSRIYRLRGGELEQLTHDHSARISKEQTYLVRAMGMDLSLDVDYFVEEVMEGDCFLLTTDGVHDFIPRAGMLALLNASDDVQAVCDTLIAHALDNGSDDNLSCQLVRMDALPAANVDDAHVKLSELPFPPVLTPGMTLDGFRVLRELKATTRSQIYLVEDVATTKRFAMKTPSVNYEDDVAYKERFVLEPWIAQRIDSPHVVRVHDSRRVQTFLYYLCDFVDGQTLGEWMQANPRPGIERVMAILHQLIKAVRALHRKETLHQDIKPDNIMIDDTGHVTLIDFGSCHAAGMAEIETPFKRDAALGTETYSAPEYKLGRRSSIKSDLFSIAVVLYELLTGEHPYGEQYQKCQSTNDFYRLKYRSACDFNPMVPVWLDGAIRKALQISPELRYDALSEFVYDLEHPNPQFLHKSDLPLAQRNPLRFWQGLCGTLALLQLLTLWLWLR